MNIKIVHSPRPHRRARVIALHYWGAGPSQWRHLAAVLGGGYEPLAPEHTSGVRAPGLGRESAPSRLHVVYAPAHPILRQRLGAVPDRCRPLLRSSVALGYGRLLREYRMPRRT